MGVVAAAARLAVEQFAADVGVMDLAAVFVLQLDEAAAGAAVAQRLPLRRRHLVERLDAPKRRIAHIVHSGPRLIALALADRRGGGKLPLSLKAPP
jgi:hypothetical protein